MPLKLNVINVIGTVALAAATASPAIADDPGANPIGKWVCLVAGTTESSGLLTITETDYAFVQTGAQSSSQGSYRIDQNFITVTSGPLKDDFGLSYGHFNTRTSPIALTFKTAMGRGLTCNPDIDA